MKRQEDRQAGQVLVQVALMMVVLLGFLALAVDVSQVYLKRRQLQNAADAGALEGARQICFEGLSAADAEIEAENTARLNAPNATPDATGSGWEMTVVVNETIPSFVASILGQSTFNPGARAKAVCGPSDTSVGGIIPLTVGQEDFDAIDCQTDNVFTVFTEQAGQEIDCAGECDCENMFLSQGGQMYPDDYDYFTQLIGQGAPNRIDAGDRGWLRLFEPPDPLPFACGPPLVCPNMGCWMQQLHPGPISVCDQVPGQNGVAWSNPLRQAIEHRVNMGDIVKVPLFDNDMVCGGQGSVWDDCSGAMYRISDFGCVRVLGYATVTVPRHIQPPNNCTSNLKVVFAQKQCSCTSYGGGTGGGTIEPGQPRSVSLVE